MMMRSPFLASSLAFYASLTLILSSCFEARTQEENRGYKVAVGNAVPNFELTDIEGKQWSRARHQRDLAYCPIHRNSVDRLLFFFSAKVLTNNGNLEWYKL